MRLFLYQADDGRPGAGAPEKHGAAHEHGPDCAHEDGVELDLEFDEDDVESEIITMIDEETGEEFRFMIADDFEFEDQVYCVLVTLEEDPQAVIVRIIELEDGSEGFESLEDSEFDRVSAEYDRLCEEAAEELGSFGDEDDEFDPFEDGD
ncbi:MAG: DUF1292 domain-containing protein [Bacillota bacterium]|nr:DUF1292 domain-containing protein [Bacillota bacterium]